MMIDALLPMKGHSQRVPSKNIREFAGSPLFHHVARVLDACEYVQTVFIDTDSETIAQDALANFSKISIIHRPEHLCGDFVPMNEIIAHDLSYCNNDNILQTHSTNPLLSVETLNEAIRTYFDSLPVCDSLFSVTQWQTRFYWESGEPVNHNPQELLRTQDLPPLFEENSNIYLFSKASFFDAGKKRIGGTPKMFSMDRLEAIDIDEEADFRIAELLYQARTRA